MAYWMSDVRHFLYVGWNEPTPTEDNEEKSEAYPFSNVLFPFPELESYFLEPGLRSSSSLTGLPFINSRASDAPYFRSQVTGPRIFYTESARIYRDFVNLSLSLVVLHVNGGSLARRRPHFPGTAFSCLRAYVRTP